MTGRTLALTCLAAGAIALGSACGGSDTAPSPPPTTTTTTIGGGGGGSTTITITSGGVNPKAITVARGAQVTFTNSDTAPHDMASNPHPIHTDCPEISVGFLSAGQSRTTASLNTPRTCGYHDHNRSGDTSLQGTITIQ
jgi:plastocyanin